MAGVELFAPEFVVADVVDGPTVDSIEGRMEA